ncbi:P-loop NTPase fold protein [Pseudophaeobacter sp.]|uniref:P-loop NTPase fold protein n=1 Tax=Pseudophaeobacter sp. TaxID=1971739 RepID=UPI00329A0C7B
MKNQPTVESIKAYLQMREPGYALLIDAPWGAGKTHLIRKLIAELYHEGDCNYATLNGVSDVKGFRRALLSDSFLGGKLDKSAAGLTALAKVAKLDGMIELARDVAEDQFIANLPDTLIFDDLERSTIDMRELLGLLNQFVEHSGKRVILVMNSDELEEESSKTFLSDREKVVGRTVKLVADFEAAFPHFLGKISVGKGRDFFEKKQNCVRSVFEQAGHQNLRLVRNATRDCAILLDKIQEKFFEAEEPMERFVRTYFALAMALGKGEITSEDLENRDSWRAFTKPDAENEYAALSVVANRHEGADVHAHSGAVICKVLAEFLFVDGHIESVPLNALLTATGQFVPQDSNPLWKRMIFWTHCGLGELESLIAEGESYLFKESDIDPGAFLHIAWNFLRIHDFGGFTEDKEALTQKIIDRISELKGQGGLPEAKMGTGFGWARDRGFSYGGYLVDPDEYFLKVMNEMADVQISVFKEKEKYFAQDLLAVFKENLTDFHLAIAYTQDKSNFYGVPVFHNVDQEMFAIRFLQYLKDGKFEELGQCFEKIRARHNNPAKWNDEVVWFAELKERLEALAKDTGLLASAQLRAFFSFHWKFGPPVEDDQG